MFTLKLLYIYPIFTQNLLLVIYHWFTLSLPIVTLSFPIYPEFTLRSLIATKGTVRNKKKTKICLKVQEQQEQEQDQHDIDY